MGSGWSDVECIRGALNTGTGLYKNSTTFKVSLTINRYCYRWAYIDSLRLSLVQSSRIYVLWCPLIRRCLTRSEKWGTRWSNHVRFPGHDGDGNNPLPSLLLFPTAVPTSHLGNINCLHTAVDVSHFVIRQNPQPYVCTLIRVRSCGDVNIETNLNAIWGTHPNDHQI